MTTAPINVSTRLKEIVGAPTAVPETAETARRLTAALPSSSQEAQATGLQLAGEALSVGIRRALRLKRD